MKITLIVIGDEILSGQVTDTNSGDIARIISRANWRIHRIITIGDDADSIRRAVTDALETSDIILTTGGLGPTKDDITKGVMQEIFGGETVIDAATLENVERICAKRHIAINNLTRSQAAVPSSARIIQNEVGTAPIMWFERDTDSGKKVLVTLPGVPHETVHMMNTAVFPELLRIFGNDITVSHRYLLVYGIIESKIAEILDNWERELPGCLHLAYLPVPGYVRLRLDGIHSDEIYLNALLDAKTAELHHILGDSIFSDDDIPLAEIAVRLLKQKGLTLSTAESCTGGNIAHRITLVPGASDIFNGGIVSYANSVKTGILGVNADYIATYGAVSEQVASQMAVGAAQAAATDCSIATSGIAGPGGGTPQKPVGTVCIAVHTPSTDFVSTFFFPGNRERVIERATSTALIELIRRIK